MDKKIFCIVLFGLFLRLLNFFLSHGASHFSDIDELKAYIWGQELYYYNHGRFFTYLPGPWQNIISFLTFTLFNSVLGFYVFWVAIGTLQIYLIYSFVLSWFSNKKMAYMAAIIQAVFPWSIQYTSTFWNPYFIIPLFTLFLILFIKIIEREYSKLVILTLPIFALMPFFHMLSAFLVPAIIYIYKSKKVKLNWKYFFYGLTFSLFLYIPFLWMDYQNDFYILKGYFSSASNTDKLFRFEAFKIFSNFIVVISLEVSRFVGLAFHEYRNFLDRYFLHHYFGILLILLSLLISFSSWIYFLKNIKRDKINREKFWILFQFIWVPATSFFILTRTNHEFRYTNIYWPILILILGNFLNYCHEKKKWLVYMYLIIACYFSISLMMYHHNPGFKQGYYPSASLMRIEYLETIIRKNTGLWNGKRGPKWKPNLRHSEGGDKNLSHSFLKSKIENPSGKTVSIQFLERFRDNNIIHSRYRKQDIIAEQFFKYNGWISIDNKNPNYFIIMISKYLEIEKKKLVAEDFQLWGQYKNDLIYAKINGDWR